MSLSEHTTTLRDDQRDRYARQIALPEIGEEGQGKLLAGSVLVVGAGGLGSPAALYLAAAGVGRLGIVDGDRLELSNLQRQVLHDTGSVGRLKAESATARLKALNPDCRVETHALRLDAATARDLIRGYDFVLDCTDNFDSKFLVADACHFENKPYSHAGVDRFRGQTMTVLPGRSACYRCLFDAPPPPVAGNPVGPLGVVPGILGTVQAAEAIRHLAGVGKLLTDRLLVFDTLDLAFRTLTLQRNPECPLCGNAPRIAEPDRGTGFQPVSAKNRELDGTQAGMPVPQRLEDPETQKGK